uniref:hypothetical protein n=1 Tax=Mesomycoplasma ovipneumoniae TaxID=29562 RepID=UPI003080611F
GRDTDYREHSSYQDSYDAKMREKFYGYEERKEKEAKEEKRKARIEQQKLKDAGIEKRKKEFKKEIDEALGRSNQNNNISEGKDEKTDSK